MSVLPILLDLADELTNLDRHSWYDDITGGDIFGLRRSPSLYLTYPRYRYCPYLTSRKGGGTVTKGKRKENLSVGKDGFQVCMDVQQFKPNELTVKTVDNSVVVEGKHEEREDEQGFISRHFVRRYTLPKGYDPKEVVSTLSSDGILTVKAPPPPSKALKNKERVIQIQQTGPAHLNIKDNSSEKDDNSKKDDEKMEP